MSMQKYLISIIFLFSIQSNVLGACTEVLEDDSEEVVIKKSRDCRNYYSNLKKSDSKDNDAELERVKKIMNSNENNFSLETDKSISKNLKSSKKNKENIDKNIEKLTKHKKLITKNKDLIKDNIKVIKKNEKLLFAVNKDLYKLEDQFGNFRKMQKFINKLNAKAIGQNLGDISTIFKDLAIKQKEINQNQLLIEENKALIDANFIESMELLVQEQNKERMILKH